MSDVVRFGFGPGEIPPLDGGADEVATKLAAVLEELRQWDMLTLDTEGHGAATADAPWACALIDSALAAYREYVEREYGPQDDEEGQLPY